MPTIAEAPIMTQEFFLETPGSLNTTYDATRQALETLRQLGTEDVGTLLPWQSARRESDGRLRADNEAPGPSWMSNKVIDDRIARLEKIWDQGGVPKGMGAELENILLEGRHRREKPRMAVRVARGIGALAATSTLLYAGFEWLTHR